MRSEARRPEEIELAIWFHDAVYDTKRKTNERESADWARSVMRAAGLSETSAARVTAMILATRHDV